MRILLFLNLFPKLVEILGNGRQSTSNIILRLKWLRCLVFIIANAEKPASQRYVVGKGIITLFSLSPNKV